jgi:hypothetical protein
MPYFLQFRIISKLQGEKMKRIISGLVWLSLLLAGCSTEEGTDEAQTPSTLLEQGTVEDTPVADNEPTDPQYQNLKLLAGKTLSLTYNYALLTTDVAVMADNVTDTKTLLAESVFTYSLNGVGPYGNLFFCVDIKTASANGTPSITYPYQYYCTWEFSSGGKNAFAFNIEGSKLVGVYEYVASYSSENSLVELQISPDATLYGISSIVTTKTTAGSSMKAVQTYARRVPQRTDQQSLPS